MDCPTCPRCHQPIRRERFGVYLPELKGRIVDAIAAAGDIGISAEELGYACWPDKAVSPHTVKAHIYQINDAFADSGVRIRSERGPAARHYLTCRREIKTYPFDAAEMLAAPEAIAAYLAAALETNDSAYIAKSIGTAARALTRSKRAVA
jgi:hypothetical protein